jgi:hypothetical protein
MSLSKLIQRIEQEPPTNFFLHGPQAEQWFKEIHRTNGGDADLIQDWRGVDCAYLQEQIAMGRIFVAITPELHNNKPCFSLLIEAAQSIGAKKNPCQVIIWHDDNVPGIAVDVLKNHSIGVDILKARCHHVIACHEAKIWALNKKKEALQVDYFTLPEFVKDSLNIGIVAVCDGMLYATTFDELLGNQFKREEVTIVG